MKGIFVFLALLLTISWARNSGINIALLQDGFNGIKDAFFIYVRDRMLHEQMQDMDVSGFHLTAIQMVEYNQVPDDFDLNLHDQIMSVDSDNFAFKLSMVAERAGVFSDPLDVWGDDCEVTFDLTPVLNTTTGLLSLTVSNVILSLDNLACSSPNGALQSTVSNLLDDDDFVDNLEQQLQAGIQQQLTSRLNDLTGQARGSVPLPRMPFSVSTMMVAPPDFNNDNGDYMTAFFDGTCYFTETGYAIPPIPEPVQLPPVSPEDTRDVQMYISDYVWNSLLYAMWDNDMLDMVLTDQKLPLNSPLRLTTDSMEAVFPGLLKAYGPGKALSIHCMDLGGSAPGVISQDNMMKGSVAGFCDLFVIEENWVRVLTYYGNADFTGHIIWNNNELGYQLDTLSFNNINIQDSHIDPLDNANVQAAMNNAISSWLPIQEALPMVLIPSGQLTNPDVRAHDGYTEILFDLVLQPYNGNYDIRTILGILGY
jgi:hypothetical protein